MHFSICETYLVKWCSIDLWSIGGGGQHLFTVVVFHGYMVDGRRRLYIKLMLCSGIP